MKNRRASLAKNLVGPSCVVLGVMGKRAGTTPPDDLTAFYAEQFDRVRGSLVLFTGDRQVGEELAQEAFVRACQHWEKVRKMESPGGWVHRVGINLAISRGRKASTERRTQQRLRAERPLATEQTTATDLHDALAELAPADRAVLVLRFFADLSVAQVAEALRIPQGTVKTRTRNGLDALRSARLVADGENEMGDEG